MAAKDAKEAAKLVGMVLLHFGYLKPYSKGNRGEAIDVKGGNITASFNVWFSTKTESGKDMTVVIAEATFVKKVGIYIFYIKTCQRKLRNSINLRCFFLNICGNPKNQAMINYNQILFTGSL